MGAMCGRCRNNKKKELEPDPLDMLEQLQEVEPALVGGLRPRKFQEFANQFEIGNIIGQGPYGEVRVIRHRYTKQYRALRVIKKKYLKNDDDLMKRFETELMILGSKKFDHTAVIKLKDIYEDERDKWYLIVTELLEGGELYTQINNNRLTNNYYSEADAVGIIYELLNAIKYCNSKSIICCDLKPENILFDTKERKHIRLIDF